MTSAIMTDIAITPSGRLYGIDFYNLYRIDTSNAAQVYIGSIDAFGGGFNSLVAIDDYYLLGVRNNSELYRIRTSDADTTLIGFIGYAPAGDITFYNGSLYMADATNHLIRIKMNEAFSQIISVSVVGLMNTPNQSIYGVLTVGSNDCSEASDLKLLAFEFQDVYEVDVNSASCTLLCDTAFPSSCYGATSLSEIKNQRQGDTLAIPNVFSPNNDGVNDYWTPISTNNISAHVSIFNRWGEQVFEFDNTNGSWDGRSKNKQECPEGVYFYVAHYFTPCNKSRTLTGFFHLVR